MSLYLDASVIVPMFAREGRSLPLRQWALTLDDRLLVGRLGIVEVGSALSRKHREKQIDDLQHQQALTALDTWIDVAIQIVEHEPRDMSDANALVRRPDPKLLPADAIHLATARRLGLTLVTDDAGLQASATFNRIAWLRPV